MIGLENGTVSCFFMSYICCNVFTCRTNLGTILFTVCLTVNFILIPVYYNVLHLMCTCLVIISAMLFFIIYTLCLCVYCQVQLVS